MNKILLLGSMPPPIGGVSIHIDRFLHFSNLYSKEVFVDVYDIKKRTLYTKEDSKKGIFLFFNACLNTDIIHIHLSSNIKLLIALMGRILRKKVIYTHHNSRIDNYIIFKYLTYLSHKIILVNDKEINLENLNMKKIKHIPAFLPPYQFSPLPLKIIEKIKKVDFVLSTNCFQYTLFEKKDLYGFDVTIKAYANFVQSNEVKKTLLVIVDPSGTTKDYVTNMIKNFSHINNDNFLYVTEKIDFVSLIKKSNLTIRATRSDGDSLSIRESLYLGVPIIASDVTYRPEGTIIFKNENVTELEEKILTVYQNKEVFTVSTSENFAGNIFSLYRDVN